MASRRLRPRWPRRTFPGESEALRVFSFPSWCLFHHPTIRKAWTNEAKGRLWRRSAPWSRLFLGRKLGVPRNIPNLVFFIRNSLVPNLPCFNHPPKNTAEKSITTFKITYRCWKLGPTFILFAAYRKVLVITSKIRLWNPQFFKIPSFVV